MADEEITETPDEKLNESGPIKQLRAAEKAAKAEASGYRTLLMKSAYAEIGLTSDNGLGKAIAKEYNGEPTTEALIKFAQDEYGYTKPVGEDHSEAQIIVAGQAALDQASEGSGSATPRATQDALAKAEAEGDNATRMAIKGKQVADWFK
jgi:hypothetical protein